MKDNSMDYNPTPLETLFLWRLLASEGGEFLKDVKPDPKPAGRRRLEQAGLIEITKRRQPAAQGSKRPVTYISLTDSGWHWASEHLDAEVSAKSPAAGAILQAVMQKLKVHLADCTSSLADFITGDTDIIQAAELPRPTSASGNTSINGLDTSQNDSGTTEGLASRIREACQQLRDRTATGAIRLATLRSELPAISHDRFDQAIRQLERDELVVLHPFDNPRELNTDDENAALPNSAGLNRHILYLVEN
jgi:hypothetical protein